VSVSLLFVCSRSNDGTVSSEDLISKRREVAFLLSGALFFFGNGRALLSGNGRRCLNGRNQNSDRIDFVSACDSTHCPLCLHRLSLFLPFSFTVRDSQARDFSSLAPSSRCLFLLAVAPQSDRASPSSGGGVVVALSGGFVARSPGGFAVSVVLLSLCFVHLSRRERDYLDLLVFC
jgi:hypothetical protein